MCGLYRAALYLYPPDFRRRFGREMLQVFRAGANEAAETCGFAGLAGFGLEATADWMLSGIREGVAYMSMTVPFGSAAAQPASGIPVFYTCDESLPRTSALINGAVLAAGMLAGVCFLIAHGGGFPSVLIGRHEPNHHLLSVEMQPPAEELSTVVKAKPEPAEPTIPLYFRLLTIVSALDANHDGVISSTEISNAPAVLAKLDTNHDGKLDADECGANFGEHPQTAEELTRTLMAFDRNHDGKLERGELPDRLQGLFDRGDRKKAGFLTAEDIRYLADAETASGPRPLNPQFVERARLAFMQIHPVLAALDRDHNAEISSDEMRNAAAMLRTLDDNQDGMLTVNEILPDPVAAQAAQFISIFDANNDRAISRDEWAPGFGKRLRQVLVRAGGKRGGMVTGQDLVTALRSGSGGLAAYNEMLAASRQGFAAMMR